MKKVKNHKKPLVSVIIPVYNGGQFIVEAIESILCQAYKNLELIIVNDGSKDNTLEIIKSFAKRYPKKIKAISYSRNKGESAAANMGFAASKGEFIARMDADDVAYPEKIEKQVTFMLSHPQVIVLGTQADVINEEGEIVGKKTFPTTYQTIYKAYGFYHPMLHPSCLFRRSSLPYKDKLWENTHEPNDDYYTLFGLLERGKFANLSESLVAYRIHAKNKSLQKARSKVFHALKIRIDAIRDFGYKPTFMAIAINFAQLVGAIVLPEHLIVPAYLVFRGMTSPEGNLRKISTRISYLFTPIKNALSPLRQLSSA